MYHQETKMGKNSTFRIIDNNECVHNLENFIRSFESQYKIDIRDLPQWKKIVQRLHETNLDLKRRIQDAELRKKIIIQTLYTQMTRQSPFVLTYYLTRTSKKWEAMEAKHRKGSTLESNPQKELLSVSEKIEDEMSSKALAGTRHPNSEIVPSEDNIFNEVPKKTNVESELYNIGEQSHLPFFISTNRHKNISPVGSKDAIGPMSYNSRQDTSEKRTDSEFNEWSSLKQTSLLKCFPAEVAIIENISTEQILTFSIINCYTKYVFIKFQCVIDKTYFKTVRIFPETCIRLYPGIALKFRFVFKLCPNENHNEFASRLYFKVGRNVITESFTEAFFVPFRTKFIESRAVAISETVYFTPKYSWHINGKCGYPTGLINVSVNDKNNYHLRINKRVIDLVKDSVSSSEMADGLDTESFLERADNTNADLKSDEFSTSKALPIDNVKSESLKTIDYVGFIAEEILQTALDTFVFKYTYLNLPPFSKQTIPVFFTKAERTGCHHSYYDLNFCDPDTETIIVTKTVLLLSEVLPHPVEILPQILDMSQSPITHGICEDRISISNTHRIYNVSVKFKLTKKMRKLFNITPLEGFVHPRSKADFIVRMCSRDFKSKNPEDFVHFTVKIIFSGPDSVYHNVPPLFYEIIAPCASEFKAIYNENYYKELSCGSLQENISNL